MTDGYGMDATGLSGTAGRMGEVADEVLAATALLDAGAGGDLGPGVTAAVDGLTQAWSGRLRAVHDDVADAAAGVRAVRDRYVDADEAAAAGFRDTVEFRHGR